MAFRNEAPPPGEVTALIVAAGRGSRMGMDKNKVLLPILGKPVLAWTMLAFIESRLIRNFVLVIGEDDRAEIQEVLDKWCPGVSVRFVYGGDERQHSVYNGLMALSGQEAVVLIHDAARPFIEARAIRSCINAVFEYGAACVGVPVKDTIKRVDIQDMIMETPNRSFLWQAQTPQGFKPALILAAHQNAIRDEYRGTDDSMIMEHYGHKVRMIMGGYHNIKITTPEDMAFAEAVIKERNRKQ
jgi:2-C-methyl-D-erythritol 4-phosphate cytidylyltransferase